MKKFFLKLLFASSSACLSLSIQAQDAIVLSGYQSLNEIHNLVTEHVKQKIDQKIFEPIIHIRKLSSNLKLSACQEPISLLDRNPTNYVGRMTISVVCKNPNWRVFVPTTVDGKLPVVMTTKAILKGAVINHSDLKLTFLPYRKVPKARLISIDTAIGMRTKKSLGANTALRVKDLQPPFWVFENQYVTLISRIGGIEVKMKGRALSSGVEHQQVSVKNTSSQKTVKGIVIAPNTVLIP